MSEPVAWNYAGYPEAGKDARCLVTLRSDGMVWTGIRAWNHQGKYWQNNGEPEKDQVLAWQSLPQPATGRWSHGVLVGAEQAAPPQDAKSLLSELPEANELAAMIRDAKRYRWLRSCGDKLPTMGFQLMEGAQLDAAIDAAMNKEPKK